MTPAEGARVFVAVRTCTVLAARPAVVSVLLQEISAAASAEVATTSIPAVTAPAVMMPVMPRRVLPLSVMLCSFPLCLGYEGPVSRPRCDD
jgi:hypothetical protein